MVNIKDVITLLNTRTIQFIIGTVCILILIHRLDLLFQLDENRSSGEAPKKYRQRLGRMAKNGALLFLSEK